MNHRKRRRRRFFGQVGGGWKAPVEYCSTSGKVMFDKKGAQTAANHRMNEAHENLRIYHCGYCNHWHLTSQPYRT